MQGDIVNGSGVCPSIIIFVSGAELENRPDYFNETW